MEQRRNEPARQSQVELAAADQQPGKIVRLTLWLFRLVAAGILLQTLFFKFTGHEESVTLFTMLGMEPWGRIGTGVAELVAAVLLLIPATSWLGALAGTGLMSGAVFFHFTTLGIRFGGDARLFSYAVITLACCLGILYFERNRIPVVGQYLATR